MDVIFQRTSVRHYDAKPIEPEKAEQLLRAAMAAPSAMNQQPWEFYVIRRPTLLQELGTASPYAGPVKEATLAIVPCIDGSRVKLPEYAAVDLSAACENILLEAEQQELGACWIGIAPVPERVAAVGKILHLPEQLTAFAIIALGYPASKKPQSDRYDAARVHELE